MAAMKFFNELHHPQGHGIKDHNILYLPKLGLKMKDKIKDFYKNTNFNPIAQRAQEEHEIVHALQNTSPL